MHEWFGLLRFLGEHFARVHLVLTIRSAASQQVVVRDVEITRLVAGQVTTASGVLPRVTTDTVFVEHGLHDRAKIDDPVGQPRRTLQLARRLQRGQRQRG